jgi:DNA ligase-1
MKFSDFVDVADEINNESKTTVIVEYVSELFSTVDDDSLEIVPRFIQGEIFPAYDERKTRISTSLMRQAISEATGVEEDKIKSSMTDVSDMGELFDKFSINSDSGQQQLGSPSITVTEVYDVLSLIANTSGSGSQAVKVNYLVSLMLKCSPIEAKYLTRLILGNMSIGVGSGTIRKGISEAHNIPEDNIERALMLTNDAGKVLKIASENGKEGIDDIDLSVCEIPLLSMKAGNSTPLDAMNEMDSDIVYGEYKYDGFRIQAHKKGDEIKLYTRNLQDVTSSLPDIVEVIQDNIDIHTVVLDGEIVGYESTDFKQPLTYQKTQKRIRRKHNIEEMIEEIPVKPHFFDILHHEEYGLQLDEPYERRLRVLSNVCSKDIRSRCVKCSSVSDIQKLMSEADDDGHEGAMIKHPQSNYEPNSRGKKWLKLKPEGETIDAVVVGGEYGDGRLSDFISSFELAIWDKDTDELVKICNVGNGVSDELLAELTKTFEDEIIEKDGRVVKIRPTHVVEVRFEEVQTSPEFSSGYSLRFPRVVQMRDTKSVDDADSVEKLKNIAKSL